MLLAGRRAHLLPFFPAALLALVAVVLGLERQIFVLPLVADGQSIRSGSWASVAPFSAATRLLAEHPRQRTGGRGVRLDFFFGTLAARLVRRRRHRPALLRRAAVRPGSAAGGDGVTVGRAGGARRIRRVQRPGSRVAPLV